MSESYIVKPVAKALHVLEFVAEEGRELTLTEIAFHVHQPKTTVFRYLQTLRAAGFISYDPKSDRYRTGIRLWALNRAGGRNALCDTAIETMRRLRDRFNETVNLGEIEGKDIVYLEIVESRRSLRMEAKIGARDPIYTTALGKAILSGMEEARWDDHLPEVLESRLGAHTLNHSDFYKELRHAAKLGFAVDRSENEEGAFCVAAPILQPKGNVVAAISVSAPDSRITPGLERQIAEAAVGAATEISIRLSEKSS